MPDIKLPNGLTLKAFGDPVPAAARCTFCGKGPAPGATFGTEPEQWDYKAMVCGPCWDSLPTDEEE